MAILTISRQLGAGETTIIPALAERLGWRVEDQTIVNREAEMTGISLPHAQHWDEHDPTWVEKLHGQGPEFAAFLNLSRRILNDLADGGNVIIVGRGGNLLLRGRPDALHVRLIGDMPSRIKRVMEVRWLNDQPARELIAESDRSRAAFYRHIFHVDWNDPLLYDLVIRTDAVGPDKAVDLIAGYFEQHEGNAPSSNALMPTRTEGSSRQ